MKLLVTVASRHGSTWEIGARIAAVLAAGGHLVDLVDPEEVESLDGYDGVVLGSAVYLTQLLPSARNLLERLHDDLVAHPLWLFASGLASPVSGARTTAELAALTVRLGARDHRLFRGRLDRAGLSFAERIAAAGVLDRDGDHRDFRAVERWAGTICADLGRAATASTRATA